MDEYALSDLLDRRHVVGILPRWRGAARADERTLVNGAGQGGYGYVGVVTHGWTHGSTAALPTVQKPDYPLRR